MSNEYIKVDTKLLDEAISKRVDILNKYNEINDELNSIVDELLANWQGQGAEAFQKDVKIVKRNISGIFDVLKNLCDTIEDCKYIISEKDTALGDYNRDGEQS